jgi:cystine transport system ATP-binding protein/L-cystine transport system ATP-binding protein
MMLEVRDARKSFDNLKVLDGISLDVEKSDVVAILGPSGSGKTTLLRCLNFLEKADSGTMIFDGKEIDMNKASKADIAELRKKTAFVFQSYNLFLNKTVLENVTLGLTAGAGMKKHDAIEIAEQMLRKVGMADKLSSYPAQLSGGQQQRVAIARALASKPEIIFFDEPTSALDPELIGEVLNVMRQLAEEGMTMLVVTHEMSFARNVSSKVVFIEDGRIVESGPSGEFFANPREERTRAFLRSIELDK